MLAAAVAFAITVNGGPSGEWTTVYLIERSLSLDNVFLISLLLTYFVPAELRGRVVLIGVALALVLRGIAIAGGLALIERVESVVYLFGALLLYVAYRALRGTDEESDPAANPVLRVVRRIIPTTEGFAVAACSSANRVGSMARRCCSRSSRSASPTSPSPSTRFPQHCGDPRPGSHLDSERAGLAPTRLTGGVG